MQITNPEEAMKKSLYDACSFGAYEKTRIFPEDITTDKDYQKNFNHYYRVRRDADWLKEYYAFLQKNKSNKNITYEEILCYLSNIEHTVQKTTRNTSGKAKSVEASFASKMLATINPDHPIWDSQVLNALNIKLNDKLSHEEKIQECVKIYKKIEEEIAAFIASDTGEQCIALFNKTFPDCADFSPYKKVDFYLWNLGK